MPRITTPLARTESALRKVLASTVRPEGSLPMCSCDVDSSRKNVPARSCDNDATWVWATPLIHT